MPPSPDEPLHVGRPNLGDTDRLRARFDEILESRWFTNGGRFVGEFEDRLCDYLEVDHCVAMCNATVAIEILTRALDLEGEVIVPSFTFVATAHALRWRGITPVFADIDPDTHNLCPEAVERAITPRTSAIMGVHLWGRPCPVDALQEIAGRHGIRLLFDAAHALGCSSGGRMIGGFGEAEVFSFHATKFVNAFEGGVVATNNGKITERMQQMKNFGFVGYDQVDHLGTNGKMCEISAAAGLTNLESVESFIETNRQNYQAYRTGLAELPWISLLEFDPEESGNFQYVVAEVDPVNAPITRDGLVELLHQQGIIARRYFYPGCHRMEPYCTDPGAERVAAALPATEEVCERVLVLPTGTAVTTDQITRICEVIHREGENKARS